MELVEWTLPALKRKDIGEEMKGFVFALQAIYDKEGGLKNVKNLKGFEDGNSITNLFWWIYSRG
jgi:endo-1,3(4)-beta-glucanase